MLNKLRIGKKLTLSFGIVIMLLLAMTIVTAYSYSILTKSTSDVLALFERSIQTNEAIDGANEMRQMFLVYLTESDPQLMVDFDTRLRQNISIMQKIHDNTFIDKNRELATEIQGILDDVAARKNDYVKQEAEIAGLRADCNAISDKVARGLQKTCDAVHEMIKKTAASNDQGEQMVEITKVELEKSLMDCVVMVGHVLSTRDSFVYSTRDSDREWYEQLTDENLKKLAEGLMEIQPLLPTGEISTKFGEVIETCDTWGKAALNYIESIKELRKQQDPLRARIMDSIDKSNELLVNITNTIESEGQHQHSIIAASKTAGYLVAAAAILIAVTVSWLLTKSVSGGITGIVGLFRKITGEGDLNVAIDESFLRRSDEIGELANQAKSIIADLHSVTEVGQAAARGDWTHKVRIKGGKDEMNKNLAAMFDQVNEVLQQVHGSVQQVSAGASQVNSASESLSQGATESAASLEEITSSMTEMGSQTHQNAQNAAEASHLAKDASNAANNGQTMMKQMIHSMEQITKNSQDVQKVVKVIDDIAFQTNLLALNAAVEAARAGVHGKGFAVVAEEVRNLAARCAKAAGETTQMIENNNRQIKDGAEIAEKTAQMLDQIVTHVASTTNLIHEIATASNEQAQGVSQVTQALQQIDAVTQQNSASAEETASVSSEMNSHVGKLQQVVERFKLRSTQSLANTTGYTRKESKSLASYEIPADSGNRATLKKTATQHSQTSGEPWGGGTATAVLPKEGEPNYDFKLDDSEFGKF
ncbi:MAG: methyl-accepting chemotaxis protein [Planctomycetaceae bacterium]|nr:methyl-accepting chemotaxis protein [Planctomycetaceae bacterium]